MAGITVDYTIRLDDSTWLRRRKYVCREKYAPTCMTALYKVRLSGLGAWRRQGASAGRWRRGGVAVVTGTLHSVCVQTDLEHRVLRRVILVRSRSG
jgi:hypothetical protein